MKIYDNSHWLIQRLSNKVIIIPHCHFPINKFCLFRHLGLDVKFLHKLHIMLHHNSYKFVE